MRYCDFRTVEGSRLPFGNVIAVVVIVWRYILLMLLTLPVWGAAIPSVKEIINRSVANSQANWKAAPDFTYIDHEIITKGGQRTDRTYRVLMIDGSPYNETIAIDGKSLGSAAQEREQAKLRRVTEERDRENSQMRRERIAKYQRGRRQDHELMSEMIHAFDFTMGGLQVLDGRECYRLNANPKPGYIPRTRDTKVLTGMRGTLWVDTKEYQWVKVEAGVFRTVSFGLFIAHVEPGTEFVLDEAPVKGNIWEPVHFVTKVRSTILHFWSHNSTDDESFSNYQRTAGEPAARAN